MTTLDRSKIKDARLVEAVRRGMLDPKVAARQVDSPLAAKKLRGRARHLRRTAPAAPPPPAAAPNRPPSARFLRAIAFTRASVVKHRIAAEDRAFDVLVVDEAKTVEWDQTLADTKGVPLADVLAAKEAVTQNVGTPASGADRLRQTKEVTVIGFPGPCPVCGAENCVPELAHP